MVRAEHTNVESYPVMTLCESYRSVKFDFVLLSRKFNVMSARTMAIFVV